MSRKPNLALAAMQALSGPAFAQDNSNGGYKPAGFAKPFDGFKTTNIGGGYQSKTNESTTPNKWSGAATYGSGMSVGNMEKNLKRDIQELDWELEMNKKYVPPKAAESEAQLKPKLFSKKPADKQEFNNTGETRATVTNTVAASDWDLPDMDEPRYTSKPTAHNKVPIPKKPLAAPAKPALGKSGEKSNALDWDLGDNQTMTAKDSNLHKASTMPRKQ